MNIKSDFTSKVSKLIDTSRSVRSFAYKQFDWPDHIDDDQWWFSKENLSIYGTPLYDRLTEEQLKSLSKWECANLFSLNVTGEQELISNVIEIMRLRMLSDVQDYLHHFIEEESQHMWYFNKFCTQYIGRVYDKKTLNFTPKNYPEDIQVFLTFSRIAIFEEVGHHFNVANSSDKTIHPFIAELNRAHKFDEGRHISFGRHLIKKMAGNLVNDHSPETLAELSGQLVNAMTMVVESFYNPGMYRDAGIGRGMVIRQELLRNDFRVRFNRQVLLGKVSRLFQDLGFSIISTHENLAA